MASIFSKICFIFVFINLTIVTDTLDNHCNSHKNKTYLHIRSIMTRQSEMESREFGLILQTAVDHINNMEGILDDYYICFGWNHAKVSGKV